MDTEIVVVSGLPRSGTSLMMQLLDAGGIETLTDNLRTPDTDNPRGYYEFERVKKVKENADWLPEARGKAVKMVSQLLYGLPPTERYRVVFMERDMDEILDSQEKMLQRLGRTAGARDEMSRAFELHLNRLHKWVAEQVNFAILRVRYSDVVTRAAEELARVNQFLAGRLKTAMAQDAIDPLLYRNKR